MFLDQEVERRKFEREVALLKRNEARLWAMGARVVRAAHPEIDILCVPRLPLRIGIPVAATASGLVLPHQVRLKGAEFVAVAARAFGVRFDLEGYDQQAPSVTFRDPWYWSLAPYAALPIGQLVEGQPRPQNVLLDGHPVHKRPFLCLRGVREYHEHPQHDGDDWAMYRGAINVLALVERIARVTMHSVRPQIVMTPNAPNQLQMQLQWAAENPR